MQDKMGIVTKLNPLLEALETVVGDKLDNPPQRVSVECNLCDACTEVSRPLERTLKVNT